MAASRGPFQDTGRRRPSSPARENGPEHFRAFASRDARSPEILRSVYCSAPGAVSKHYGQAAYVRGETCPSASLSELTNYFVMTDVHGIGPVIGQIAGAAIHDYVVDGAGHRFRFARLAPRRADGQLDVRALRPDEWIVEPGLAYRWESADAVSYGQKLVRV